MANSSHIPITGLHEVRSNPAIEPPQPTLRPVSSNHAADQECVHPINGNTLGPRKLIRPTLPTRALRDHSFRGRGESPISAHNASMATTFSGCESSNAEAFYFQKQMQTQTLMIFVLEDGDRVEGHIEWYDRNAIKVRNGTRTLIYKSSIKYLYKAGEVHP
jgi:sRNA-binding regulator protein Hfq